MKYENSSLINQLEKLLRVCDKEKVNTLEEKIEDQELEWIDLTLHISTTKQQVTKMKLESLSLVSQLEKEDGSNHKREKKS